MPIVQFSNVSFCYPTRIAPTLSNITLDIEQGDFLLVSGPTGCGKTTLLKTLNGIIPRLSKGTLEGALTIAGKNAAASSMEDLTREVGVIFQCPDDQIVSSTVEEEIAFGLENIGLDAEAIAKEIGFALERMGIGDLRRRDTKTLSGGQKQRTVIASQIALRPKILALDEPLSQLDPRGAREVMKCIAGLNSQGVTVVMVEHRIADVARYANKVLLLDAGRIVHFGEMKKSFSVAGRLYKKLGIQMPEEATLSLGLGLPETVFSPAVLEKEIRRRMKTWSAAALLPPWQRHGNRNATKAQAELAHSKEVTMIGCFNEKRLFSEQKPYITLQNIQFGYKKDSPIFRDLNLVFHSGESVALMGANGSGKSTLLSLIAGIRKPQRGHIVFHEPDCNGRSNGSAKGAAGILIQNPDLMLFCESVEKEMFFGAEHRKVKRREGMERVDSMLGHLYLNPHRKDAPFSLSVGQRLRTALGSVLTMHAPILLLDEPTTGQNQENITRIMETVRNLGFIKTRIFCTHDIQTAMNYAGRVIVLQEGAVVYDGSPLHVFDDVELAESSGLAVPASILLAKNCGFTGFHAGAAGLLDLLGKGSLC